MEWATSFSVTLAASSVFSFFPQPVPRSIVAVRSAAVIFFQFFFIKPP